MINFFDNPKVFDDFIFNFLMGNRNKIPKRLAKFIAIYYPDARIRKKYSKYIGLKLGEKTFANLGLKVVPNDNEICVSIGNNVSIAPNVVFICQSSANNGDEINNFEYVTKKLTKSGNIIVSDEVWIGANVTILPGVVIGRCSIIGAGSVVTENIEAYSIYAGTPARKIRSIKDGKRVKYSD